MFSFIFDFCNPSVFWMTKALICTRKQNLVFLWYSRVTSLAVVFNSLFCIVAAIFYICMRITLVKSWSHPGDTTYANKQGVIRVRQVPTFLSVTTLSGQEILYRSNRAETWKGFPRAFESNNLVTVLFSLACRAFRDKVLLQNFTRVLLRLYM